MYLHFYTQINYVTTVLLWALVLLFCQPNWIFGVKVCNFSKFTLLFSTEEINYERIEFVWFRIQLLVPVVTFINLILFSKIWCQCVVLLEKIGAIFVLYFFVLINVFKIKKCSIELIYTVSLIANTGKWKTDISYILLFPWQLLNK